MRNLAAIPLLYLPLLALADCKDQLQTWARALHPTLVFDTEHAVCKTNPAEPQQVLAALTFTNAPPDEYGEGEYDLEVLVADAARGAIIAHHYQSAAISSDAIQFEELSLDTARYQIAPQSRAFGVRVRYKGSSRVNPYNATSLNLYTLEGPVLRQVMDKLQVEESGGEWDGNCAGDFYQKQRTLAIGGTGNRGFAKLNIDEKNTGTHNVPKGDDCQYGRGKATTAKYVVDYDGSQYSVPQGLVLQ